LLSNPLNPDIAISMGCNVKCPFIGRTFDDNWGQLDPTGKLDEEFKVVIKEIEIRILHLKEELK
jgi:arsenate reductase